MAPKKLMCCMKNTMQYYNYMAPRPGLEPGSHGLTVRSHAMVRYVELKVHTIAADYGGMRLNFREWWAGRGSNLAWRLKAPCSTLELPTR